MSDDDGLDMTGLDWFDDWRSPEERREAAFAYAKQLVAWKRQDRRRELAREIATVKALAKAGLPIKRAIIDGLVVELGQPDAPPTPPAATLTALEAWRAKHARRS
jgi:hypothetical protein